MNSPSDLSFRFFLDSNFVIEPVGDKPADQKVENSQRHRRHVKVKAERAQRYPNVYTSMKVNNKLKTIRPGKLKTIRPDVKKTTKKSKMKVTERNLRTTSDRRKIKMTKKPEMAKTTKKLRAKDTTKKPQTGETMKRWKAKEVTKKPEMGITTKKLKAKDGWRTATTTTTVATTTMIARKKTKEPAMETSMKSEAGEVKRNLKLKSTFKAMKTTKMSGRGKSMKPRATVKRKGMTMKPRKVTTMMLSGERVKRAANDTKTTPEKKPMTSGVSGQKCILHLSLVALISIVMKSKFELRLLMV